MSMPRAHIIGTHSTAFRRWPERDLESLAEEALLGAIEDAGLDDGGAVEQLIFGNCGMHLWGQPNIRGQALLSPLMQSGRLPARLAITNVEAGCVTGSLALQHAARAIWSGEHDLVIALGAEKTFFPDDPMKIGQLMSAGADLLHRRAWLDYFKAQASSEALEFAPRPDRIIFLDTYALQARYHMKRHGTTAEQIAASAAKNHDHGALNPKAQYRKSMSVEEVLADKPVVAPFTRAMCSPISDGAAAVVLASDRWLRDTPAAKARAIEVAACATSGGRYRDLAEPSLTRDAAKLAYARAEVGPEAIDVAELHDSTAFCELYQCEMLGFCEEGDSGAFIEAGETKLGGSKPVNPSGGLVSKGHPLAATGLGMVDELVLQLRDEAGERQVERARIALAQNAGGLMGLDEAGCAVTVLKAQ